MKAPKAELYPLVADYHACGYPLVDIAFALKRSPERIRQVLIDQGLIRPRIRSDADIPVHLLERTLAFRNL